MFRPRRAMPGRRRGGPGLGLFLLAAQIMQVGFNHIPPTTLATIGLNVAIYLKVLNPFLRDFLRDPSISSICVSSYYVWYKRDWIRLLLAGWFHLDDFHLYYNMSSFLLALAEMVLNPFLRDFLRDPSISSICVSSYYVWYKRDWIRLLLAGWFHLDDFHLYYNMSSFLWKGRGLEGVFGTWYFAYLILVFSVLTNVVMVGVNIAVAELLQDASYVTTCAAGFSGVIFALKVLTSYYTPPHMQRLFGMIPVPSRWACWIELVVIQLLVPRASFTGHLAGILIGLAYVKGPLKTIMDIVFNRDVYGTTAPSYTYSAGTTSHGTGRAQNRPAGQSSRGNSTGRSSGPSYTYAAESTGGARRDDGNETSGFRANDYTGGMSEQEQIDAAIRQSMRTGGSSSSSHSSAPLLESSVRSPTLPPHPDSNPSTSRGNSQPVAHPSHPSNSRGTTQPVTRPPSLYPNLYLRQQSSGIDQDEVRRRRLARFDSHT